MRFFKRKHTVTDKLIAPVKGHIIPLESVDDPMFSQKILGDGVAIEPSEEKDLILAPCDGVLTCLFKTGHAFGISTDDGIEVLVHVGIDTVKAQGNGFQLQGPKQGDKIKAGEPVLQADFATLRQNYKTPVMVIVTKQNGKNFQFTNTDYINIGESIGTI